MGAGDVDKMSNAEKNMPIHPNMSFKTTWRLRPNINTRDQPFLKGLS